MVPYWAVWYCKQLATGAISFSQVYCVVLICHFLVVDMIVFRPLHHGPHLPGGGGGARVDVDLDLVALVGGRHEHVLPGVVAADDRRGGVAGVQHLVQDEQDMRYALKKKTILFGIFSQTSDPPPTPPFWEPLIPKKFLVFILHFRT